MEHIGMTKKWKALAILGWLALGLMRGLLYAAWNTDGSQLFRNRLWGRRGRRRHPYRLLDGGGEVGDVCRVAGLVVGGAVGLVATSNTEGLQLFGMAVGALSEPLLAARLQLN
jgi:hypothetical protein